MQTETLTITATPLGDGMVKAKTGNTTNAEVYADWYKAVYVPTPESSEPEVQSVAVAVKVSAAVKTTAAKEA